MTNHTALKCSWSDGAMAVVQSRTLKTCKAPMRSSLS